MPRWLRVIRGMIGMGLTFSAGVGVVASMIAVLPWLVLGGDSGREMIRMVSSREALRTIPCSERGPPR